MGGHAVKLIGWGTSDDGDDYWVFHTLQLSVLNFNAERLYVDFVYSFVAASGKSVEQKLG